MSIYTSMGDYVQPFEVVVRFDFKWVKIYIVKLRKELNKPLQNIYLTKSVQYIFNI